MIVRALWSIGLFAVGALGIALAVANRHVVRFVLDPFNPQSPVIFAELPFYIFLIGMLVVGVFLGSAATWVSQGKWRRLVRVKTHEAMRWKGEAERLTRERDATVAERKKMLAIAGR